MNRQFADLPADKKIYLASDFHLGVPDYDSSLIREKKIIRWLDVIKRDAAAIFLVGDIFDFWFEYKHVIPKGFIRIQGKFAELRDAGIPLIFYTGNHDMWMFDYFKEELGIPIYRKPQAYQIGNKKLLIGHGDGLGPGDYSYKILKKIFENGLAKWLFRLIHPDLGMAIAKRWSKKSRISNEKRKDDFLHENEWLLQYAREIEVKEHFDYYIFGHRHLPLELEVIPGSTYINLGEWVHHFTYVEFDGNIATLKTFDA